MSLVPSGVLFICEIKMHVRACVCVFEAVRVYVSVRGLDAMFE